MNERERELLRHLALAESLRSDRKAGGWQEGTVSLLAVREQSSCKIMLMVKSGFQRESGSLPGALWKKEQKRSRSALLQPGPVSLQPFSHHGDGGRGGRVGSSPLPTEIQECAHQTLGVGVAGRKGVS